ncbi:hypothetical protein CRE_17489 [Caenorhabditis remanei]|uniref:HMG box domain-containing protein n=1 Tax=Caenorhabditis remanei TaxID=31234 RepID=E3N7V2_CAERE|nr:hypothetical protein CRE_17489 [Caenorhabditis remanei]
MKPRHKQNFNEQNRVKPTEIVGYKNWKEKELASRKENIEMRNENEWVSIWNKELTKNERHRWMNDAKKEEKALLELLSIEKPPQDAYHLWFKEKVPEFKKKDPHLTFGDLSKMMAEVWNSMSEVKRRPFHEKLRILRIIFEEVSGLLGGEKG